jgi:hypothetical protein
MKFLLAVTFKVEKVLDESKEALYEPLKEEHEKFMSSGKYVVEK